MLNSAYGEILQLADEIGGHGLLIKVDTQIERGRPDLARITILGCLDECVMDEKSIDDAEAKEYYDRLGFSMDEMLELRTASLSLPTKFCVK